MSKQPSSIIEILETYLAAARQGFVKDIVVVALLEDDEYIEVYQIHRRRLDDMILQLRTAVIKIQCDAAEKPEKKELEH